MSPAEPETVSLADGAGGTARGMSRSTASRPRRSVGHAGPTEVPDKGPMRRRSASADFFYSASSRRTPISLAFDVPLVPPGLRMYWTLGWIANQGVTL